MTEDRTPYTPRPGSPGAQSSVLSPVGSPPQRYFRRIGISDGASPFDARPVPRNGPSSYVLTNDPAVAEDFASFPSYWQEISADEFCRLIASWARHDGDHPQPLFVVQPSGCPDPSSPKESDQP